MKGTEKALMIWEKIPHGARLKLLNNVYCGHCKGACSIADAHVVVEQGDFLIKGHCIICSGKAVRYVEI